MNKREFVLGSCATLAGGAASACPATQTAHRSPQAAGLRRQRLPDLVTELGSTAWQAYVGHRFDVLSEGARTSLTLTDVVVHDERQGLEQFTLHFERAAGSPLGGRTHVLAHPSGQKLAVYLDHAAAQPVGTYRADFSLIV
jgi:hypothetical protein